MSTYKVTYVLKGDTDSIVVTAGTGAEASDVVKEKLGKRIKMVNIERIETTESMLDFITNDLEHLT
ncbi:MAG: hypothetical protein HRS57_02140 [Mycoplasmataceae bacterium]|nr:hypothetical protein [Mycoplasmataceae bacterium]